MGNPLTAVPMKAARWSAEHPWRAIFGWIAFVAIAVGLAFAIPTHEATDADYRIGESGRADAMVAQAHLERPDTENILITAGTGTLDAGQAQKAAAAVVAGAKAADGVASVADPQWNQDRTALLVSVDLEPGADDAEAVQAVTDDVQADFSDLQVREAGDVSVDAAINDRVSSDLGSAEITSLPVTLLLMVLAFGALIAAGIPVLLAGTSVAATLGLLSAVSHLIPADSTVSSMIVLIGMAVGVDYSLFYLKRAREEHAKGRTTLDAVEIAARTSGHSILVSGGAVIASMAGLFVVGNATFNSLAIGAILVVAIAVLGSITVLPALLVKLGRWVDRPRVPLLWRLNSRLGRGGISSRLLCPGGAPPGRRACALGRRDPRPRDPCAGHEDPLRDPRHAARLHPAGADDQGHQQELPRRRRRLGDRGGALRRPRSGRSPRRCVSWPTTRSGPVTSSPPAAGCRPRRTAPPR